MPNAANALDIPESRVRSAELDRDVRTGSLAKIIVHIQARMNGEAVLRRELFDQLAHFPVADNREFHASIQTTRESGFEKFPVERFYRALQVGRGHHHA